MSRVKRVLSSLLLLALFMVYQVSITMFTHVHYINGVMIVHSHPNKGKHDHSKTAIVVIDRLSVFQTLEADVPVKIEPECPLLCKVEVLVEIPVRTGRPWQVVFLRAPPIV